jgi:hypothetical protein
MHRPWRTRARTKLLLRWAGSGAHYACASASCPHRQTQQAVASPPTVTTIPWSVWKMRRLHRAGNTLPRCRDGAPCDLADSCPRCRATATAGGVTTARRPQHKQLAPPNRCRRLQWPLQHPPQPHVRTGVWPQRPSQPLRPLLRRSRLRRPRRQLQRSRIGRQPWRNASQLCAAPCPISLRWLNRSRRLGPSSRAGVGEKSLEDAL